MSRNIVIVGATSAICRQVAVELVKPGDKVCLAARNADELSRIAADIQIRNSPERIIVRHFDTNEFEAHQNFIEDINANLNGIDIVLIATGVLGDQTAARESIPEIVQIINSNFVGIATVLAPLANIMEAQGYGRIAVLSSVVGDRGRQSNYIYGSAKSGINGYLSGLRNRLYSRGVSVTTIKLGFVDTKMITGMNNTFLHARPDVVAKKIVTKIGASAAITYIPWFWRYIMLIIIHIPEIVFKRLRL